VSGWVIGGVALIVGCAAVAQAVSGFGYALLAVPVLSALTSSTDAVVVATLAGLPLSPLMLVGNRHHVDRGAAARLVTASLAGMPLGLVILNRFADDVLRLLIGGIVLVLATLLATGFRVRRSAGAVDVGAGFVSGVLATSTGTNGPPLVFGLQARGIEARAFRSTLAAVFVVSGTLTTVAFVVAGKVDGPRALAAAAGVPFVFAGVAVGRRVAQGTDPATLRRLVIGLLYLSAFSAIATALA
jgi:uncharacterized membrane protein YfcA